MPTIPPSAPPTVTLENPLVYPRALDELTFHPSICAIVDQYAQRGEIMHTLFYGPASSGKTTLVNRVLTSPDHGLRVLVIENELGAVSIDHTLIDQARQADMPEGVIVLNNGCMCCSGETPGSELERVLDKLRLKQPKNGIAYSVEQARLVAADLGLPLVVRPSYVLGGRAMEIVYEEEELKRYMREAVQVSNDSPVLLDHFLNCAIEVDVDAVCDGETVVIGGIMQHIEQAGVHSGDSACSLPAYSLPQHIQDEIREQVRKMALELDVVGLMNVQMAVQGEDIYVLEVNPRASRTRSYASKVFVL